MLDIDHILRTLNDAQADYILIGGMNFLLRHVPELTFDIDVWVADTPANLTRVNHALRVLGAEWGPSDSSWKPVPDDPGWLTLQPLFCLTTRHGALDVFRDVRGLEGRYAECRSESVPSKTPACVPYQALSDRHMLETQLALPEAYRKDRRIAVLKKALGQQD